MKVPLSWLKEYVDITLPAEEVARRLTMAGAEVRAVERTGGGWRGIVVGRITAVNPHPNADRLKLVTIDHGQGEETVVCGAPNVAVGAKVAFAPVGAELIDPRSGAPTRLTPARIRGVTSRGMALSERELGISDDHTGILVLPDEAEVGRPLADYLGDVVFNLDITPNRPDCLSVLGIAREVAALTGQPLRLPPDSYAEAEPAIEAQVSVEIQAADLCPRYCASLITGVTVGESPPWLKDRLVACGMRPINNVVDVTNYVMLEYGQPLHAFDFNLLRGQKIVVRRARPGEAIVSLDGVERVLSDGMLVIADAGRAVAVAGIMGGANSEVSPATTAVLLEAASFNPRSIHYTARTLGLQSEASMRFERGLAPGLTLPALRRATCLIAGLAGGRVARGLIDEYPGRAEPPAVAITPAGVERVLGVRFERPQIERALTSLGFECREGSSPDEVVAAVPYWRSDISRPVDLVEEVARTIGYDEIPTTMLSTPIPPHQPDRLARLRKSINTVLTGYGFQEIVTHSLTGRAALLRLYPESGRLSPEPLRLRNPMVSTQECLRPTLRLSLLETLAANQARTEGPIRLYELGKVYRPRAGDLPEEPEVLCGVIGGAAAGRWWRPEAGREARATPDFFDAKGMVEGLLRRLGVEADFEPADDETLVPGRQAAIMAGGQKLGVVGEVRPVVLESLDIEGRAFLFELGLAGLLPLASGHRRYQPVPRFPATVRDMALVVDAAVPYRRVADIIRRFPLVHRVTVFDVYVGEQVPPGKKSLACRVTYQAPDHTLSDEEVNPVQEKILKRLARELGATLRS